MYEFVSVNVFVVCVRIDDEKSVIVPHGLLTVTPVFLLVNCVAVPPVPAIVANPIDPVASEFTALIVEYVAVVVTLREVQFIYGTESVV